MNKDLLKRIGSVFSIFLSITIVIAGICFMVACVGIYNSGDQPFSRESVAASFSRIAIPVYICLAAVIASFVLGFFLPREKAKLTVEKQRSLILQRLHDKTDLSQCDESLRSAVLAQQKSRRLHRMITAILLVLGAVIFLIYALNGDHFHRSEINDSMIKAMYVLIPCVLVPFAYAVFTAYYSRGSMDKEIALLKQADTAGTAAPKQEQAPRQDRYARVVRCVILVAAIAVLIYGFFTGGTSDVLTKAVNICTECVGLG